jgi:hypothetical protein
MTSNVEFASQSTMNPGQRQVSASVKPVPSASNVDGDKEDVWLAVAVPLALPMLAKAETVSENGFVPCADALAQCSSSTNLQHAA